MIYKQYINPSGEKIEGESMNKISGNYFLLPNKIFKTELSGNNFIVYSYLVRSKNKNHQCWPSRATIARECKIKSITTVDKCLQYLEDNGYIYKTKQFDLNGKGQKSNIYTVNKIE